MATLTVSHDGLVTVQPEVLRHLGVGPGQTLEVDLLPDRHIAPAVPNQLQRAGSWDDVFGCLAGKTDVVLTIEQITEASGPGLHLRNGELFRYEPARPHDSTGQ